MRGGDAAASKVDSTVTESLIAAMQRTRRCFVSARVPRVVRTGERSVLVMSRGSKLVDRFCKVFC